MERPPSWGGLSRYSDVNSCRAYSSSDAEFTGYPIGAGNPGTWVGAPDTQVPRKNHVSRMTPETGASLCFVPGLDLS